MSDPTNSIYPLQNATKIGRAKLFSIYIFFISNLVLNETKRKIGLIDEVDMQKISLNSLELAECLFSKKFVFEKNGFENLNPSIYLAQHQSAIIEIITSILNIPNLKFAFYSGFKNIPGFNFFDFERFGHIPVGSEKDGSANDMINGIIKAITKNHSFLFYPEGGVCRIEDANSKTMPGGILKILKLFFDNCQNNQIHNKKNLPKNLGIPIICTDTGLLFSGKTRVKKYSDNDKEILNKKESLTLEIVAKITKNGIEFLNQNFKEYFQKECSVLQDFCLIQNELINLTGKKYNLENQEKFYQEIKSDLENENFEKLIEENLILYLKNKIQILKTRKQEEESKGYLFYNSRYVFEIDFSLQSLEKQISILEKFNYEQKDIDDKKARIKDLEKNISKEYGFYIQNISKINKIQAQISKIESKIQKFEKLKSLQSSRPKTIENLKKEIEAIVNLYQKYQKLKYFNEKNKNDLIRNEEILKKNFDKTKFDFEKLNSEEKSNFLRKEIELIFRAYNKKILEELDPQNSNSNSKFTLDNINESIFEKDKTIS